ncbi:hypothetical protein FJZ33_08845, partial [Candidatus Poribacteria bacterium]|nr:hypothetical protein [Candidatus Poribacteria bacterium]
PDQVSEAIRLSAAAIKPVVIYGNRAGEELSVLRRELSGKAKFLWMAPGTNSLMASTVGLNGKFNPQKAKFVYVLAGDAGKPDESIMTQLKDAYFVVVQSSYAEPWAEVADYILPTVTWAEKEGTITNLENRIIKFSKAIQPPVGVKTETEILEAFKEKLR